MNSRFKKLTIRDKIYTTDKEIDNILFQNKFYWLIDSEIENAEIEIKNDTIIWKTGLFICGNWKYGIWESGTFLGRWENGIFVNGDFRGKFISGINEVEI